MKALIAKTSILSAVIMILAGLPLLSSAANDQRQAEVVERGKDIMPFNLKATTHVFTKTPEGGIQRVMVKDLSDVSQTKLVREHLRAINQQFLNGNFSGPSHIHGQDMPGLAELDSAKPGQIVIDYREVEGGVSSSTKRLTPRWWWRCVNGSTHSFQTTVQTLWKVTSIMMAI